MLEKLDPHVAATVDPNFSVDREYLLDNAMDGLRVLIHDTKTGADEVIPLTPEIRQEAPNPTLWDESTLEARANYNRKQHLLSVFAAVGTMLVLIGFAALLIKGAD